MRTDRGNRMSGFSGDLLTPGDSGYHEASQVWNAMIVKRPAMIARCRSTEDVVAALAMAGAEGLEVAVRGGGHSISGLSTTDGGMMIDLQLMRAVEVDPVKRLAKVQGGARLAELDRATHDHGLATTGGMVHHTGVAGLTLGGGYGWLARLHGLACDNMTAAEVVTAGGDIVRASDNENDDLLWGLRGGGGNFGIVTEFEFRLHPIGPVLSAQLRFAAEDAAAVLHAYREVMGSGPPELCGLVGMQAGRGAGTLDDLAGEGELSVWYAYTGADLAIGERLGAPFVRVARPIARQIEVISYPDLQTATGEVSGPGRRHYWKGSFMGELSDDFLDAFLDQGLRAEKGCGVELFSLGGAIAKVGEGDSAYSNRGARFDLLPAATWDDPEDDEFHISLTRSIWEALEVYAPGGVYVNDLGADAGERLEEVYGASKMARLVALKKRWDPGNTFRLNANIVPRRCDAPVDRPGPKPGAPLGGGRSMRRRDRRRRARQSSPTGSARHPGATPTAATASTMSKAGVEPTRSAKRHHPSPAARRSLGADAEAAVRRLHRPPPAREVPR